MQEAGLARGVGTAPQKHVGNGGAFSTQIRVLSGLTILFEVFLGSLAPQAQLARKASPAAMESQGRWERRASQVCWVSVPFQSEAVPWSAHLPELPIPH